MIHKELPPWFSTVDNVVGVFGCNDEVDRSRGFYEPNEGTVFEVNSGVGFLQRETKELNGGPNDSSVEFRIPK